MGAWLAQELKLEGPRGDRPRGRNRLGLPDRPARHGAAAAAAATRGHRPLTAPPADRWSSPCPPQAPHIPTLGSRFAAICSARLIHSSTAPVTRASLAGVVSPETGPWTSPSIGESGYCAIITLAVPGRPIRSLVAEARARRGRALGAHLGHVPPDNHGHDRSLLDTRDLPFAWGNARCQSLPLAWFFPETEAVRLCSSGRPACC